MVFGKQFRPAFGGITTDRVATLLMFLFLGLMLLLPLAGCGSGSGGNDNGGNNNNGTNNPPAVTRITGKVIDQNNSNQPVAGATITYGSATTTTDGSGNFLLDVTANQSNINLIVTGPANPNGSAAYYNSGFIGSGQYSLANSGFPVAPIASGTTYNVGTIIIFSQTGPPPPPFFPQDNGQAQ